MADYRDPVQMVRDIREHVLSEGHRVQPADDPFRRIFGYMCSTCETFWTCGLVALKDLEEGSLMGEPLTGVLRERAIRERLTAYLNWELEGESRAGSIPASVPILSRYKRPWVV
jgi:hypothetical protein